MSQRNNRNLQPESGGSGWLLGALAVGGAALVGYRYLTVTRILLSENFNFVQFYKLFSIGHGDGKKEEYKKGFEDGFMVRNDVERFFEDVMSDSKLTISKKDKLLASKMNPKMLAQEFAEYFYEKRIKISKVFFNYLASGWSLNKIDFVENRFAESTKNFSLLS